MPPESSEMLRAPDATMPQAQTLQRQTQTYATNNDRFALDKKIYGQYFQLYYQRLMLLLPRLKASVTSKWPDSNITKVLDLKEGEECVIIGTLYKNMKLKPSILDEYGKDLSLGVELNSLKQKFTQEDDSLVLEDEGARVKLVGKAVSANDFVTGIVLACKGKVVQDGEFEVTEVCFAEPEKQKHSFADSFGADTTTPPLPGNYVALVSGLRVGDPAKSNPLALELLLDYVTGNLGGDQDQARAANIVRVVVAGGALAEPEQGVASTGGAGQSTSQTQHAANARLTLRSLDQILTQFASSVPIDLMPGAGDPTNQALPQQPLHPCLFPEAGRFSQPGSVNGTFNSTTNPHDFSVGSCDFLGTSGQNIDNLRQYTEVSGCKTSGDESLSLMRSTLKWQHVAPSAPDTLACYPYKDRDPFYVQNTPNVYFAGGQPEFASEVFESSDSKTKTLLVSVPDFSTTGTIALVNIETLQCFPVEFKA